MLNQVVLVGTLKKICEKNNLYYFTVLVNDNEFTCISDATLKAFKESNINDIIGIKGYLENHNNNTIIVAQSITIVNNS